HHLPGLLPPRRRQLGDQGIGHAAHVTLLALVAGDLALGLDLVEGGDAHAVHVGIADQDQLGAAGGGGGAGGQEDGRGQDGGNPAELAHARTPRVGPDARTGAHHSGTGPAPQAVAAVQAAWRAREYNHAFFVSVEWRHAKPCESHGIPMTATSAEAPGAPTSFRDLGLAAPLLAALVDVGYETPSPIQAATIPLLLAGRDV